MMRKLGNSFSIGVLGVLGTFSNPVSADPFADTVKPFLGQHCIGCHGEAKPKADLSLTKLSLTVSPQSAGDWKRVAEVLSTGEMPPENKPRPSPHETGKVLLAIKSQLAQAGVAVDDIGQKLRLPQHGNRLDHAALFDAGSKALASSPARLWRVSPFAYNGFVQRVNKNAKTAQPFSLSSAEGFKDYGELFVVDEPAIAQLMRNAEAIVALQTAEKNHVKELRAAVSGTPTPEQVAAAIRKQFDIVLRRSPTADELSRFTALHEKNVRDAGVEIGGRATLAAVFLLPEAIYRLEIGQGPTDAHGRRMLSSAELADAIALALGDSGPDAELMKSATTGRLATPADVRREVRRLLDDPKFAKPRIMRFFEEYFNYPAAQDVFKDLNRGEWRPEILINDTRYLIQWVLDQDKDVLRTLLTTNKSFVNYRIDTKAPGGAAPVRIANRKDPNAKPPDPKKPPKPRAMEYSDLYNLPEDWEWTPQQPVDLPGNQRAGILTQPSWLSAFATNNETHAIRRGKWVREHLLGGTVPDLPITVDAKLPDAPDQTIRQRMAVTAAEYCWNCHQKMNPLGLTFEKYDYLGRYRETETVVDVKATAAKQAAAQAKLDAEAAKKKREPMPAPVVEPITAEVPAISTGEISLTGEKALDGEVSDAVQMIHRIAGTDRVRQVFVRHAFRYWMGRNEALDDAPTLVAADQAYVQSGGSMKALIVALLSSDSFVYRK